MKYDNGWQFGDVLRVARDGKHRDWRVMVIGHDGRYWQLVSIKHDIYSHDNFYRDVFPWGESESYWVLDG